jgi:hypothetical protein
VSSMTTPETYNGWKNYPTWAVNLWLSNDEALYGATRELVDRERGMYSAPYFKAMNAGQGAARGQVADALKSWVRDELAPDLGASFAADLLGYALNTVDWLEIADAWLEDAS